MNRNSFGTIASLHNNIKNLQIAVSRGRAAAAKKELETAAEKLGADLSNPEDFRLVQELLAKPAAAKPAGDMSDFQIAMLKGGVRKL